MIRKPLSNDLPLECRLGFLDWVKRKKEREERRRRDNQRPVLRLPIPEYNDEPKDPEKEKPKGVIIIDYGSDEDEKDNGIVEIDMNDTKD